MNIGDVVTTETEDVTEHNGWKRITGTRFVTGTITEIRGDTVVIESNGERIVTLAEQCFNRTEYGSRKKYYYLQNGKLIQQKFLTSAEYEEECLISKAFGGNIEIIPADDQEMEAIAIEGWTKLGDEYYLDPDNHCIEPAYEPTAEELGCPDEDPRIVGYPTHNWSR